MTFSLKEVVTIGVFVAGIAGAWGVTIHKVDSVEARLQRVEGSIQFLLGVYIRDGKGSIPEVPWVQQSIRQTDAPDAPGSS